MGNLNGKVALVTGSGRGIGRSVALKLASEGASVVVNDLDQEPADEVVAEIEKMGGKALACVGSVSDDEFAERFINAGIELGGLDIIVNNAGFTWDSLIGQMTNEQFDSIMDVHVKAPWRILRAATPYIKEQSKKEAEEGREVFRKVVNISSVAGVGGNVGQSNYASAKAAVIGLTQTLAKEWGRMKVNVNCVAFGLVSTRLTEATDEKKTVVVGDKTIAAGIPKKVVKGFEAAIPLGRAGTPEEAAGAVYLLTTPESNYISGQTIICGGGFKL